MNIIQAFKIMLENKIDIVLTCKYGERIESHTFNAEHYSDKNRFIAFGHKVKCIKKDFKDISTFYRGNKSDCKFVFSKMETYTFYSDPGHSWLKVKISELVELNIQDKISIYSYINGEYAYLEEDCDAGIFLRAKFGQDITGAELNSKGIIKDV